MWHVADARVDPRRLPGLDHPPQPTHLSPPTIGPPTISPAPAPGYASSARHVMIGDEPLAYDVTPSVDEVDAVN
ncbi:hypothetical protein [Streptomyces formicae]|uniref:Uncharacterized protein n=1 Tax=Streptomyces formicae TaxID=1616117 RepID=A0A291QE34_9ACTN|nr:hypothetical protein [Streptomyces formicae]ATL29971.1 hypothetical protein KY5_4953 [Streptomyces formicae]